MGFKDDVRVKAEEFQGELDGLKGRVSALENLAAQLKGSPVSTPARRAEVTRDVTGTAVRSSARSTLDYAAVAFGLSEIKRKVAQINGVHGLGNEYAGAVQYFADVFAKADPAFDVEEFKRQANI